MADNIQNLTAGNIQFRKYDYYGYPYAFCPGIRCIRRMYNEIPRIRKTLLFYLNISLV